MRARALAHLWDHDHEGLHRGLARADGERDRLVEIRRVRKLGRRERVDLHPRAVLESRHSEEGWRKGSTCVGARSLWRNDRRRVGAGARRGAGRTLEMSVPSRNAMVWSMTASRARIQLMLPRRVLISPLCPSERNGCASGHLGIVLVEKRRW